LANTFENIQIFQSAQKKKGDKTIVNHKSWEAD